MDYIYVTCEVCKDLPDLYETPKFDYWLILSRHISFIVYLLFLIYLLLFFAISIFLVLIINSI